MDYQMEQQHKLRETTQMIGDRIKELQFKIADYDRLMANTISISSKKLYERKKEWILSLLAINEIIYERLKTTLDNQLH
jgi:hypothetical protein